MFPKIHRATLAKSLTFPIGDEALAAALSGAPNIERFNLFFLDLPGDTRSKLHDAEPSALVLATFWPKIEGSSRGMVKARDESWTLKVFPVTKKERAAARETLVASGLPIVRDWLAESTDPSWRLKRHTLSIELLRAEGAVRAVRTDEAEERNP